MNGNWKRALLGLLLLGLALLVPSPALAMGMTPYGVFVAAAVLAASALLVWQRAEAARRNHPHADGPIAVIYKVHHLDLALWTVIPAFVLARLSYCLVRFSFFFMEMGPASVLRVWEGGFMLYGAVLGALLGAALLAGRCGASVPATLDELAAPGLLCTAICRLGEWTAGEGVGAWVENPIWMRFPFAVCNEYEEWQLAVFLLEAAVALVLMAAVLRVPGGKGARVVTALALYAVCQVVLESMRMDSCLKIGFVRVSQVLSAVVIASVTGLLAYRSGGKKLALTRVLATAAGAAMIGGIEWALDKTVVNNILLYGVMIAVCVGLGVNALRFEKRGLTD